MPFFGDCYSKPEEESPFGCSPAALKIFFAQYLFQTVDHGFVMSSLPVDSMARRALMEAGLCFQYEREYPIRNFVSGRISAKFVADEAAAEHRLIVDYQAEPVKHLRQLFFGIVAIDMHEFRRIDFGQNPAIAGQDYSVLFERNCNQAGVFDRRIEIGVISEKAEKFRQFAEVVVANEFHPVYRNIKNRCFQSDLDF